MSRVLVPLAQGCEELEAVTIIDLLVRGGVEVVTASLDQNRVITASRGVQLLAQHTLEEVLGQRFDLVALPGGLPGADHLLNDERVIRKLQTTVAEGGLTAAICAAPKVLLQAGLLAGKKVTAYPGVLTAQGSEYDYQPDAGVVEDGAIISSRGPGTAIDFALHLLQRLEGIEVRNRVEAGLVRA
ncbi:MAG: DJ-1/PfpI family protein [Thiotrichales bacterium]|nr:DJ-1/PfpI family protein [Thiotrichales bacterium]